MVVGPRGQKLHELGTPCPEYPGLRSEYPGRVLHYRRWNHSVPMPHSLGVQIGWFKEMLQRLAPGDDDGNTYIPHSPVTSAHSWFLLGRSMMLIA